MRDQASASDSNLVNMLASSLKSEGLDALALVSEPNSLASTSGSSQFNCQCYVQVRDTLRYTQLQPALQLVLVEQWCSASRDQGTHKVHSSSHVLQTHSSQVASSGLDFQRCKPLRARARRLCH